MWRRLEVSSHGNTVKPQSAGPGTSAHAGRARAATQTGTEKQLDEGAARMNSGKEECVSSQLFQLLIRKHVWDHLEERRIASHLVVVMVEQPEALD